MSRARLGAGLVGPFASPLDLLKSVIDEIHGSKKYYVGNESGRKEIAEILKRLGGSPGVVGRGNDAHLANHGWVLAHPRSMRAEIAREGPESRVTRGHDRLLRRILSYLQNRRETGALEPAGGDDEFE